MSDDQLAEIKERWAKHGLLYEGFRAALHKSYREAWDVSQQGTADVDWLIAEVERLREVERK